MCSVFIEDDCVAIGGPNFTTQDECLSNLKKDGLPYVTHKFYDHKPVDYLCVYWDERT